jgi:predicted dehydrogenase
MRIGLIGCGRWGRNILRDLKTQCVSVTVIDHDTAARMHATANGADAVFDAINQVRDVDGWIVATPSTSHAKIIEVLLSAGVPIFCEKPLTCDPLSAHRITESAAERVFVMDKWRYHAGVLELGHIAREETLGPMQGLVSRRLAWGHDHADADLAWTLLPHEFSIAYEVSGEMPTPVFAVAEADAGTLRALTVLSRGTTWHLSEIGSRTEKRERRIELRCRDGVAVLANADDAFISMVRNPEHVADPPEIEKIAIGATAPLYAELAAFIAYLKGGPRPKSSVAEGALIVAAIARARELAGLAVLPR